LRAKGGYEVNPNLLYFGITANQSLQGLSYTDANGNVVNNATYSDYENNFLTSPNQFYNTYNKKEAVLNVSLEHSYLQGRMRALIGYEIAGVDMSAFQSNALIQQDFNNKKILGLGNYNIAIAQVGLIYDTRDLEPDPNNGIFAELTNELSLKSIGSFYDFNKTFFHFNYYKKIFPGTFKRLVFAGRASIGHTAGDAPFFEYQDQWSSEGSIEGLGGPNTLRGFKQSRFLGRTMSFNNFELRWRFAQTRIAKQHLEFSAVPFFDVGGVWDEGISLQNNWRSSEGLGLRIGWNESTILRFDYAVSKEDQQFFFNLAHAF
jgi:outer membrane protein assembly factor BamA